MIATNIYTFHLLTFESVTSTNQWTHGIYVELFRNGYIASGLCLNQTAFKTKNWKIKF